MNLDILENILRKCLGNNLEIKKTKLTNKGQNYTVIKCATNKGVFAVKLSKTSNKGIVRFYSIMKLLYCEPCFKCESLTVPVQPAIIAIEVHSSYRTHVINDITKLDQLVLNIFILFTTLSLLIIGLFLDHIPLIFIISQIYLFIMILIFRCKIVKLVIKIPKNIIKIKNMIKTTNQNGNSEADQKNDGDALPATTLKGTDYLLRLLTCFNVSLGICILGMGCFITIIHCFFSSKETLYWFNVALFVRDIAILITILVLTSATGAFVTFQKINLNSLKIQREDKTAYILTERIFKR